MFIRQAVAADIDSILKLQQQNPAAAQWTKDKYQQVFDQQLPQRIMAVAEGSRGIEGFGVLAIVGAEGEIENLVVSDSVRRRGVGTQLLSHLIATGRNLAMLKVFLEVRESNASARALYNKFGFQENGRRSAYYHDPEEDAILYRL